MIANKENKMRPFSTEKPAGFRKNTCDISVLYYI